MRRRPLAVLSALALALTLLPLAAGASTEPELVRDGDAQMTENVEVLKHLVANDPLTESDELVTWQGSTEIDYDGERYAYIGQFNGVDNRGQRTDQGGLLIVDLVGEEDTGPQLPGAAGERRADGAKRPPWAGGGGAGPVGGGDREGQFDVVGRLHCPGTDNYVRYMDPEVYGGKYIAMAHHGNLCSTEASDYHIEGLELEDDPNTTAGYGAFNGVTIIDVNDPTNPTPVSSIGHTSAHTVMPHPTEPYLFILPGGLPTNGTNVGQRSIAPTAIVDVSDVTAPRYVGRITHNASGCHDFGFNSDGSVGFCAGFGEVSTWDLSDIENPLVIGRIHNPAIQFAHNVVISDDDKYLVINDEAFGFHTCNNDPAVDLYGSMWIYDISIDPHLPILAGRVAPPGHPNNDVNTAGWTLDWCAAHNYNFVPGTHILVSSWFAGGITAHDISDPMQPELIAHYMPDDGVMWSGHYYGGYLITGDMIRGSEVLKVHGLDERAEEQRAAAETRAASAGSTSLGTLVGASTIARPLDMTDVLIPNVLPPRPVTQRGASANGGFCVIPGVPSLE